MSRTLLKGGCVLSLDRKIGNFHRADVLMEGSAIAAVGPDLLASSAEVIDVSDSIVMPGFVDTHRHAWESLFRNSSDETRPGTPGASSALYGPHYQADDVYAGVLTGLLGATQAGITTVVDWSDFLPGEGHTEAALQAHADAGIRSVFVSALPDWHEGHDDHHRLLRDLATKQTGTAGLVSFAGGFGELVRGGVDAAVEDWAVARELGLRIHTHAGSSPSDGGLVAELAGRGLLGVDITFVHCTHLSEADLDAIAASGASISLTPSTEMAGDRGVPPMQHLIDRGVRPGLGIDNERAAPGDMFAQMRAVISVQHATLFDLKLAGKAGVPNLLNTRDVIRYATTDGAAVAGLDADVGTLRPGSQADVIVLRTDKPNIFPVNDPIGAVVWGMDTSNVDWVFVGGRALMRNGALETDLDRVRNLAVSAWQRVAGASGLLAGSVSGALG